MGNKNQQQNNNINKVASEDTAGNVPINSAPTPKNVTLKVDSEGNVIEGQEQTAGVQSTAGPNPNPEQNNNTGDGLTIQQQQDKQLTPSETSRVGNASPPGFSGDGAHQQGQGQTEAPDNPQNAQIAGGSQVTSEGPQEIPADINTDELITNAQTEIKSGDAEQEARVKKAELLTQAINSRYYFENVRYENSETGEPVGGTRIRYTQDPYKKTIYDYMNDEVVNQHIGFKVSEDDPKDGSIVDKQITIYWKNPAF